MARVRSRWSGTVYEVPDSEAARYAAEGYEALDPVAPPPLPGAVEEAEPEPEAEKAAPEQGEDRPDEGWTISEIRAYASEHGIELPRGGKKADLLALL